MAEGMPNSFEFNGGVVFITNIKFDNVKSKKLQDHLQALQSRCHYLDLTIDSMRDRMLRIRQICGQGMLEKYMMPADTAGGTDTVHIREQTQAERDLIEDGAEGGRPLEDGAGQVPGTCNQHLHEAGGMMNDNKFQDFLQWAGYILAGVVVTAIILIVLGALL